MSDQQHEPAVDGADLFISYAWTSEQHRQWVRLLAACLQHLGYHVLVDADVDYGDSLTGFMRRIRHARHVLVIIDDNYNERADTAPTSGVATENRWIQGVYRDKSASWLAVLFKDNPGHNLPAWLAEDRPKGLSFNAHPETDDFPGTEQIKDLWRWLEDLPANDDHATSFATLRQRSARLERHDLRTSDEHWRSPSLTGASHFVYEESPRSGFTFGFTEQEFTFQVSGCGSDSVYVYSDPLRAVGVVRPELAPAGELEAHLSKGRSVKVHEGQTVMLMNNQGALARVKIDNVQRGSTDLPYVAPYVDFRWEVLSDS